jgi:hypothetical protein
MGHTDEQTTLDYQHGHEDLPYEDVEFQIARPRTIDKDSSPEP